MNKRELKGVLTRPIAFFRIFAQVGGSAAAGLFLSQAHYWSDKTSDPDGWFYKTQAEWEIETALTRWEQETARRDLKKRGLLEESKRGMPAKLYYRVNYDVLCAAVEAWLNRLDNPLPDEDDGNPTDMDVEKPHTRMLENHIQVSGETTGMAAANHPAISTETTSESTQTNGHSNKNSKTNGNDNTSRLERAAEMALSRLEPREQKFVREQAKMTDRAVHEVMWDLYNAYMTEALRGLK